MTRTALVAISLLLSGCATSTVTPATPFNAAELAACGDNKADENVTVYHPDGTNTYNGGDSSAGNGSIIGQAFLRTTVGEVRYAAGEAVNVFPATAYTRELASMSVNGIAADPIDPRLNSYVRTTQAGEGEFEFSDLAPCQYIVLTQLYWTVPGYYTSSTQGGVLAKEVTVADGQPLKVILTR